MPATTLATLAAMVGGEVEGDGQVTISGAASIGRSQKGDITLADAPRLVIQVNDCCAAAVVVAPGSPPTARPRIVVDDVHAAFAIIVRISARNTHQRVADSVPRLTSRPRPTRRRCVGSPVRNDWRASDGGLRCRHSFRCACDGRLPHWRRGDIVPKRCALSRYGRRGTLDHSCRGHHRWLRFRLSNCRWCHMRGAQLGNVEIGCDVEIGAGTTIDRGTYDATTIGDGTKIDNQVMIGHNCQHWQTQPDLLSSRYRRQLHDG